MGKKRRRTRNREETDSDQGSDANDKATGKGQTVTPSAPSVDRHNSADNLANENQRGLMELAAKLSKPYSQSDQGGHADDNLRILSGSAAIHPTVYPQEKPSLITSRVDQDSSPAQSSNEDSQSTSSEKSAQLKLKRPYKKLIPKDIELIKKDLMSAAISDPEIADRQGGSLSEKIKRNILGLNLLGKRRLSGERIWR
ncbi:MAG: hypothetical protein KZQ84_19745, partial [Candidatus Thiodiazotropha sp. (ex Lucinoma borealis)]|nr:hypothetical protein [Candidatus Thiodiazotropha sp. (ex Lucinoma borealis)]